MLHASDTSEDSVLSMHILTSIRPLPGDPRLRDEACGRCTHLLHPIGRYMHPTHYLMPWPLHGHVTILCVYLCGLSCDKFDTLSDNQQANPNANQKDLLEIIHNSSHHRNPNPTRHPTGSPCHPGEVGRHQTPFETELTACTLCTALRHY